MVKLPLTNPPFPPTLVFIMTVAGVKWKMVFMSVLGCFFHSLKHWCGRSKGSLRMWVCFWRIVCKFQREVEWFGHLNRFTWAYTPALSIFLASGYVTLWMSGAPRWKSSMDTPAAPPQTTTAISEMALWPLRCTSSPEDIKIMLLWPIIWFFVRAAWGSIGGLMFRMWLVWKAPWMVLKETKNLAFTYPVSLVWRKKVIQWL